MKTVFMGTPDFAAAILNALITSGQHEVIAAYTQPDRPSGRGQALKAPPVKELALAHNIPVYQPLNFKAEEDRAQIAALKADVFVVAAYGLILPQALLDMPRHGAVNVHASLLPRYRGAAPIQRAIMDGCKMTGITIMQMEAGLDTGPMLLQRALGIGINDNAAALHDELAELGGKLLLEALEKMEQGQANAIAQDNSRANYAAKLTKADGFLDFTNTTARQLHNTLRGVTPWPGARARLEKADWARGKTEIIELLLEEGRLAEESPAEERLTEKGPAEKERPAKEECRASEPAYNAVDEAASENAKNANPDVKGPGQTQQAGLQTQQTGMQTQPARTQPQQAGLQTQPDRQAQPGDVLGLYDDALLVKTPDGVYALTRLRPAGGKSLRAADFVNGYLKNSGARFLPG